jgi:exodeoxyribonuclease VII small subunit
MADETQEQPGSGQDGAGADDEALGYEQAREALLDVVRRLEAGGTSLEESLALWERGERLAKVCQRWLDGARARLDAALAEDEEEEDAGESAEEKDPTAAG